MPLPTREDTYLTTVRGMCRNCRAIVPARVFLRDGHVFQQSLCPRCETSPALIAKDQAWYFKSIAQPRPDRSPIKGAHPPKEGCPHDCGPCTWHATNCQLPVLSVTNACNLDCPICFTYNRKDKLYYMPVDEMRRTVDWVIESSGPVDLINITGGEPTLHPQILELLACCRRPEIGLVTMNSNGLRLAQDADLCAKLAELGVLVILSLNTFKPEVSQRLHGRDLVETKLKAIENLTRAGVRMSLLNVMIRDVNEEAAGELLELMRSNEAIRSLTVQTMTYTGQGGGKFPERRHMPVDEAAEIVCAGSKGELIPSDFVSRPAAHPLCYSVSYLMRHQGRLVPFTRFASAEKVSAHLADSYLLRLRPEDSFSREVIDDLYARGELAYLKMFRAFVEKMLPADRALTTFERQRVAEEAVRTVYIHAHMDEDNFDCSRAMLCPDLVPCEPGRLVPACTYNLFYRMKDDRFYVSDNPVQR